MFSYISSEEEKRELRVADNLLCPKGEILEEIGEGRLKNKVNDNLVLGQRSNMLFFFPSLILFLRMQCSAGNQVFALKNGSRNEFS